jgi:hypothetical protein
MRAVDRELELAASAADDAYHDGDGAHHDANRAGVKAAAERKRPATAARASVGSRRARVVAPVDRGRRARPAQGSAALWCARPRSTSTVRRSRTLDDEALTVSVGDKMTTGELVDVEMVIAMLVELRGRGAGRASRRSPTSWCATPTPMAPFRPRASHRKLNCHNS